MKSDPIKVLVVCTGNSCRSIMAEALINDLGQGRYRAWSAGSVPAGSVHPKSIETLTRHGMDPGQPRSKSWHEFAQQSFDLVITVCDQAAAESCPHFCWELLITDASTFRIGGTSRWANLWRIVL